MIYQAKKLKNMENKRTSKINSQVVSLILFVACTILFFGCANKIVRSKEYKYALTHLTYNEPKENFKLIERSTIEAKGIFDDRDSIYLLKSDIVFGLRNNERDRIYLFGFDKINSVELYLKVVCDTSWRILEITNGGEIY